jgi:DNA replication protein DnaC
MRHDPAGAAVIMLRSLKMHGMAQAVMTLVEQGAPAFEAATPILSQLLKAEMAEREVRSIAYHMKAARFPSYKDLSGFDFKSSEVNEALVRGCIGRVHGKRRECGPDRRPGTGKSHVATALGVQAIEHHRMQACASSRPSNWSMPLSRKRRSEARQEKLPKC